MGVTGGDTMYLLDEEEAVAEDDITCTPFVLMFSLLGRIGSLVLR